MTDLVNKFDNLYLYNSGLELWLRALFILNSFNVPLDLDKLTILDYFVVNTNDIDNTFDSLHSQLDRRVTQYYSKKNIVRKWLNIVISKWLVISLVHKDNWIVYKTSDFVWDFLDYFDDEYSVELGKRLLHIKKFVSENGYDSLEKMIHNWKNQWWVEFIEKPLF